MGGGYGTRSDGNDGKAGRAWTSGGRGRSRWSRWSITRPVEFVELARVDEFIEFKPAATALSHAVGTVRALRFRYVGNRNKYLYSSIWLLIWFIR